MVLEGIPRGKAAYKAAAKAKLAGEKRVHRKKGAPPPVHRCRKCKCSNIDPCQSPNGPCYWVDAAETLCSACAFKWQNVTRDSARSAGNAKLESEGSQNAGVIAKTG